MTRATRFSFQLSHLAGALALVLLLSAPAEAQGQRFGDLIAVQAGN